MGATPAFAPSTNSTHRVTELHLRTVLEQLPVALMRVDADGTLLAVNDAGLGLLGAESLDVVLNTNFLSYLVNEDERPSCAAFLHDAAHGLRGSREITLRGANRQTHIVEIHAVAYPGPSDQSPSVTVTLRDVSHTHALTQSLIDSSERHAQVENALATAREQGTADQAALQMMRGRAESFERERDDARRALAALEAQHAEATRSAQSAQDHRAELERSIQVAQEQRAELEQSLHAAQAQCEEVERTVHSGHTERADLERALQDAHEQRSELERSLEAAHERHGELERSLQAAHVQREESERAAQSAHAQRGDLERALQSMQAQHATLEQALQSADEQRADLTRAIQEFRAAADDARTALAAGEQSSAADRARAETEIAAAREEARRAREAWSDHESIRRDAEQRRQHVEAAVARLAVEIGLLPPVSASGVDDTVAPGGADPRSAW